MASGQIARSSWQVGLDANTTATAFPDTGAGPIPTTTEPSTTSIAVVAPCGLRYTYLVPFGAGSDTNVFHIRVALWSSTREVGSAATVLWVPFHVADVVCTISTKVGIASAQVVATDRFCDTLAGDGYQSTAAITLFSPAGDASGLDLIGMAKVENFGHELISVDFDMVSATNGNVLFRMADV